MICKHCNGTGKVKEVKMPKLLISERGQGFINETHDIWKNIEEFIHIRLAVIIDFTSYWTEPNKSKTKMRFELERTWDTKRRLQTWIRNDKKFNPKKEYNEEKIKMPAGYGNKDSSYWKQRSSNHEPKKISELIKK